MHLIDRSMYTVQHLARADRPVTQRRREIFSVADANDGARPRGGVVVKRLLGAASADKSVVVGAKISLYWMDGAPTSGRGAYIIVGGVMEREPCRPAPPPPSPCSSSPSAMRARGPSV
jgi:hypothetical protein